MLSYLHHHSTVSMCIRGSGVVSGDGGERGGAERYIPVRTAAEACWERSVWERKQEVGENGKGTGGEEKGSAAQRRQVGFVSCRSQASWVLCFVSPFLDRARLSRHRIAEKALSHRT